MLARADWDDMGTAVWEETDPDVARRKDIATGVLAGTVAGTVGFSALALGATVHAHRLTMRKIRITPVASTTGGGVMISGRF